MNVMYINQLISFINTHAVYYNARDSRMHCIVIVAIMIQNYSPLLLMKYQVALFLEKDRNAEIASPLVISPEQVAVKTNFSSQTPQGVQRGIKRFQTFSHARAATSYAEQRIIRCKCATPLRRHRTTVILSMVDRSRLSITVHRELMDR